MPPILTGFNGQDLLVLVVIIVWFAVSVGQAYRGPTK
jgi:hypothetical protein